MSRFYRQPAMDDDSARMGKLAKPSGLEGNADNGLGESSRGSTMSDAMATLNKQVARGKSAPTVGGRKMTDY